MSAWKQNIAELWKQNPSALRTHANKKFKTFWACNVWKVQHAPESAACSTTIEKYCAGQFMKQPEPATCGTCTLHQKLRLAAQQQKNTVLDNSWNNLSLQRVESATCTRNCGVQHNRKILCWTVHETFWTCNVWNVQHAPETAACSTNTAHCAGQLMKHSERATCGTCNMHRKLRLAAQLTHCWTFHMRYLVPKWLYFLN